MQQNYFGNSLNDAMRGRDKLFDGHWISCVPATS